MFGVSISFIECEKGKEEEAHNEWSDHMSVARRIHIRPDNAHEHGYRSCDKKKHACGLCQQSRLNDSMRSSTKIVQLLDDLLRIHIVRVCGWVIKAI